MENSDNKRISGWRKAGIVAVTGLAGIVGMAGMGCGLGGCQAEYEQRITAVASTQPSNALLQKEAKEAIEFYKRFDDYNKLSGFEKEEIEKFNYPRYHWRIKSQEDMDALLLNFGEGSEKYLSEEGKKKTKHHMEFIKKIYDARAPWTIPNLYRWTTGDYFYAKQKAFMPPFQTNPPFLHFQTLKD